MKVLDEKGNNPFLSYLFFSYLVLGLTDVLHHVHAFYALKQTAALHAVVIGAVLIPTAFVMFSHFRKTGNKIYVRIFFGIALLAALGPGLYHGGWDHLVKVLGHLRIDGESTDIQLLFPKDDFNLWIYEISGSMEFIFGITTVYFLYKHICYNAHKN